jgi:hypothetical protein
MLAGDLAARKQALADSGRRIMDALRAKAH